MSSSRLCRTKAEYDAALQAAGSKLVVVDFTASWCGPCRMIAPVFEELASKNAGVVFLKVDVDENREVAQAYSVSAMPTFLFIRNKSVLEQLRGANASQLRALVDKHGSGSGSSGAAFSGRGNSLSGSSVSGGSTSQPGSTAMGILQNMGRDNMLPLLVLAGYLFYVFFLKA
ncbi:unnamed protein product [Parajaminaea phylloscopi]